MAAVSAQTTHCLIHGLVVDGLRGTGVGGVLVSYEREDTGTRGSTCTDGSGAFTLGTLSPGTYRLTVRDTGDSECVDRPRRKPEYKQREVDGLELPVAGRIETTVELWPHDDVWQDRAYEGVVTPQSRLLARPYGPDLDTSRSENFSPLPTHDSLLEPATSYVLTPGLVRELPLAGRDAYTTLVLQPGVTADTATARGLGLSVNGQRPTSANFLLDGVENNNGLLTGPLVAVAPEAIQEYRFSTSGYSAEYGRAAGVVANVVTRGGGNQWHGLGYFNVKNYRLNGNEWQRNRQGHERPPLKETQPGGVIGGPLRKQSLFGSVSGEQLRFRSVSTRETFWVPTQEVQRRAEQRNGLAARFLRDSGLPRYEGSTEVVPVDLEPRVSLDRWLVMPRVDWITPRERQRVFARVAAARLTRPDLIWTPHTADHVALREWSGSVVVGHTVALSASTSHELRAAYGQSRLGVERGRPWVPFLIGTDRGRQLTLPGSPLEYDLVHRGRAWQIVQGLAWLKGRHLLKTGADLRLRRLSGFLRLGTNGFFQFISIDGFLKDEPVFAEVAVECPQRPVCGVGKPRTDRQYAVREGSWYAQDTVRLGRLALHGGVRVDWFGAGRNTGEWVDSPYRLGEGADLRARVARSFLGRPGEREVYAGTMAASLRAGFAYSFADRRGTVVRASYGEFRDRLFENYWLGVRNNGVGFASPAEDEELATMYRAVASGSPLDARREYLFDQDYPRGTLLAGDLRPGFARSALVSVQRSVSERWKAEITGHLALGRELPTSNVLNRALTGPRTFTNRAGRPNGTLPDLLYRASEGESHYSALTATARYRGAGREVQVAYTWAHLLDYQSDATEGDFDFGFTNPRRASAARMRNAAFTGQFSREQDWGNSDFDQRHNVAVYGTWELPEAGRGRRWGGILREWRVAGMLAGRTGFAYTVFGSNSGTGRVNFETEEPLVRNRANLTVREGYVVRRPEAGGERLLNPSAFQDFFEQNGRVLGNTARNFFRGPGLISLDLSLSRTVRLSDGFRLTLRADAFNVLNHVNLNRPENALLNPNFGIGEYGRREKDTGFPALIPFVETARQVQLLLRVEF